MCICACDASFLSEVKEKTVQTSEGKVLDNLQKSKWRRQTLWWIVVQLWE